MAKKRSRKPDQESGGPEKAEGLKQGQGKPSPAKTAPKIKPKTEAERREIQIEAIKKTVYASALGVLLGIFSYYSLGIGDQKPMLWLSALFFVIAVTYFIQKFTYPLMGIDPAEFKGKDWLYVEFLSVDLWLVTWTLLLN